MKNLLNGVKFPAIEIERVVPTRQTTLDNIFRISQERVIENGSRKRGMKERKDEVEVKERENEVDIVDLSIERIDSNPIQRLQLRPEDKRICTPDVNHKMEAYKKVLALVVSGLPLTWDRSRIEHEEHEEHEEDEAKAVFEHLLKPFIGTRSTFMYWKDEMIKDVKSVLKNIISRLQSFAICTDAWSVMRPAVHLQVVFLNAFHHNTFFSLLLDSMPIESTEANCIQNATQKVLGEYGIGQKQNVVCTCDGASSNKKAYEGERSECNSHLFDNVLRHFLWSNKSTPKFKGTKNGLTYEESKLICMHMDFINNTCKSIHGNSGKLFKSFVEQFRPINTDYSDFSLPQMICPTRWIGIADQMRYLLKYGRLYHRFQLAHNEMSTGLMKHLLILQETAWLVFLLEKAMNLLTPSDKPTLHLVLPIREAMMTILNSEPCTSFTHSESKAIIKAIKYELNNGLLSVKENDIHHKRCMVATSLYPYASHIISPEQLEKYIAVTKEYYVAYSTSHQHDVIHTKDGEKNMEFPDLDNILSLLHKQPRIPLWTIGGREENQSTNHLVDILKPSSSKFELEGSKGISLGYYLPIEQFVYRNKSISLANAIDVLAKLRDEIAVLEYAGIVEEGSVEEIQIPLQPVGKQIMGSVKLTKKKKKAMKGQQLLEGRKRHRMERFGYKETPTKARMKSQSNNLNHRNEKGRKQVGESKGIEG